MLGKYLSPRLYISYGIGLFEPVSTFRIRYLFNEHMTFQAEASATQSGADVFYTFERGRAPGVPPEKLESPKSMDEVNPPPIPTEGTAGEGTKSSGKQSGKEAGKKVEEGSQQLEKSTSPEQQPPP